MSVTLFVIVIVFFQTLSKYILFNAR